ncbi:MAG: OsmC family peroxiredoxin, partial [Flavobacteriaceae bacterium]|nr:OsmC family peroxiredoxin [Flavobacteriaceae bacterium]
EVTKIMTSDPRRIAKIVVDIDVPIHTEEKTRKILEHTARTCPVLYSLHPEIEKAVTFNWGK